MDKSFKVSDLLLMRDSLQNLMDQPIPVRATFAAKKMLKRFGEELDAFQQAHNDLLKKHGEPDKEGGTRYTVPPENLERFRAEVQQLMDVEVTIPITRFKLRDLENTRLKARDVVVLEELIEGEDE